VPLERLEPVPEANVWERPIWPPRLIMTI